LVSNLPVIRNLLSERERERERERIRNPATTVIHDHKISTDKYPLLDIFKETKGDETEKEGGKKNNLPVNSKPIDDAIPQQNSMKLPDQQT
jgi:hypothetical protein